MSDAEEVCVEVRELAELILKEPALSQVEQIDDTSAANELGDKTPIEAQAGSVEVQKEDVPTVVQNKDVTVTPECDLRLIESNALKLIAQYGSDSDSSESSFEEMTVDAVDEAAGFLQKTITDGSYRVISSDSEDSTSSDDSDVEVISIQNEIITLDDDEDSGHKHRGPIKVEGEFSLDSLPPIEDLKISVPEDECVVLGKVSSVVNQLVVIDSLPGSRPIDIDSVLFLEKGTKALGHVFDVFGSISNPMYCVRFNSNQEIQEKGIAIDALVYVAPRTEHTNFVILSELMKDKGSDASWKNDIEPVHAQDFSDDEEERKARRLRRGRNNDANEGESEQIVTPSPNQQNQRNPHNRAHRRGRGRGRGNFNRGGHRNDDSQHSWHNNLPPSNWNSPMVTNRPIHPFPPSFLLPPPPPPPRSNSHW